MEALKLMTIPEFARTTGLNYWLAWQLVKRGSIPSVLVGTRRRIDSRWLEQWLAGGGYYPSAQDSRKHRHEITRVLDAAEPTTVGR